MAHLWGRLPYAFALVLSIDILTNAYINTLPGHISAGITRTGVKMSDDLDMDYSSGIAAFEAKNFAQAMMFLSPLAETGNADAMHRCAIMYQNGLGVVQSEERAFEMMQKSAESGYAIAQHGLGFMYMTGECVDQDYRKAIEWFEKAADQGLVGSLTTLAMMYEEGNGVEKNPEKAKELYKQAGF